MVAGCGAKTAKIILVIVNSIFVLLGLGVGIAGLVFKYGLFKDKIISALEKTDVNGTDTYSLLNSAALLFIIVGFFILGVGIFGCSGACCEWRPLLVVYALIVAILLIVQIVGVALFSKYRGDIEKEFKDALSLTLRRYYGNNTEVRDGFKEMFDSFECCGANGPTDFPVGTEGIPPECCPNNQSPCPSGQAYSTGCGQKFIDALNNYNAAFIGVGVSILVFQLLCVVFAFCLCCAIGRDE